MLPLLLFAAGHVKNDIPLALAAARRAILKPILSRPGPSAFTRR